MRAHGGGRFIRTIRCFPFVLLGRSFIVIYTIINDTDLGEVGAGRDQGKRERERKGDLRRFGGYSCPEDYTLGRATYPEMKRTLLRATPARYYY